MISFRKIYMLLLAFISGIVLVQGNTVHATESMEPLPETVQEGNMYAVNPDGTGDFVTIQEGVDSVESGDTLVIYPGVYEENVIVEDKTVNLIGVNSKDCILTANSDNYHHIPLTIAAGRVSGLTICGTSTKESVPKQSKVEMNYDITDPESIYLWQNQYSGYTIHIDQPYSAGKTLSIENCRIISENNYCIGIGCWERTEIMITDCELISGGHSGCIFMHNISYPVEVENAHVTIKNSEFKNYVGPYVMAIHSKGNFSPIALTFQNVRVSTVAYEDNDCYSESNVNTWIHIDQLTNSSVQTWLSENGYSSLPEGSQLVHQCTVEQRRKFIRELKERSSLLKGWPKLAEGITYWESDKNIPLAPGKIRHSIDIQNVDEETVGDGWCGLAGIYLTEDSYGNTLPEMNYPRLVITSVTESE